MNIFISHSNREKWAARKIAEELESFGCTTFLDEKDIETGEPIDDTIHTNLNKCDHFLLLLSPSSLQSQWVLVELGGALAMKKHVVPILMYVSPNEVPQPIQKYLARDINELDKYYAELKRTLKGRTAVSPPRVKPPVKPPELVFKVGDRVLLPEVRQDDKVNGVGWNPSGKMDKYCGKEATVTKLYEDFAAYVDIDGGRWVWPFEWLSQTEGS